MQMMIVLDQILVSKPGGTQTLVMDCTDTSHEYVQGFHFAVLRCDLKMVTF